MTTSSETYVCKYLEQKDRYETYLNLFTLIHTIHPLIGRNGEVDILGRDSNLVALSLKFDKVACWFEKTETLLRVL
jgi:hypothetical protein